MIRIRIGDDAVRDLENADESWINQQINRRRDAGEKVCVQVNIEEDPLNMVLSTPNCPSGGGGRSPNDQEQKIFDLWNKCRLNREDFSGGNLVAFLKQLRRL